MYNDKLVCKVVIQVFFGINLLKANEALTITIYSPMQATLHRRASYHKRENAGQLMQLGLLFVSRCQTAPKPGLQSRALCGAVCALSIAIVIY